MQGHIFLPLFPSYPIFWRRQIILLFKFMPSTILGFLPSSSETLPPEKVEETFPDIELCKLNKASHLESSPSFDWICISKDFPCNLCLTIEHNLLWSYFLFWFILIFPYKLNILCWCIIVMLLQYFSLLSTTWSKL